MTSMENAEQGPGGGDFDESPEVAAYLRRQAERARHHMVLASIRADLEGQPSPACVRIAARRWTEEVIQTADEVVKSLRNTG